MPFSADTYRVFIASPSDVPEERQVATDAVHDWNSQHAVHESVVLLPVKWETHSTPETGVRPQEAVNDQLVKDSDILVGLFWTKIGTNTGVAESGTVEEINEFVAAKKPAMLYFSSRLIDPNKIDLKQYMRLKKFREATYNTALVGSFSGIDELRLKLLGDLTSIVRKLKAEGLWASPSANERERCVLEGIRYFVESSELPMHFANRDHVVCFCSDTMATLANVGKELIVGRTALDLAKRFEDRVPEPYRKGFIARQEEMQRLSIEEHPLHLQVTEYLDNRSSYINHKYPKLYKVWIHADKILDKSKKEEIRLGSLVLLKLEEIESLPEGEWPALPCSYMDYLI